MTTVTGLTADRMLAIEAASIVDGDVIDGNLILTKHDGTQINAGSVVGPAGPQGPVGSDLQVLSARSVLDVGLANQIRAGRQLSPADFANIGLNPPLGLWNLSDLTDASGYGRNLTNRGSVGFVPGINGTTNTAVKFNGATTQSLYVLDTGVSEPFRIRTGTIGCWFKTAKQVTQQGLVGKYGVSSAASYLLNITNGNVAQFIGSSDGVSIVGVNGVTNVCDDCWHFAVGVGDGSQVRIYVDGILEGQATQTFFFITAAPVLIGAWGDNNTSNSPHFGKIDEAFITSDVLTEDQIRNLYCARITHTLGSVPSRSSLNVRRRRRGVAFAASDFPTPPLRLHNFSAGSLGDEGSHGITLTNNNGAVVVAGADGTAGNAYRFTFANSQSLSSADTGLPTGTTNPRSYGCWVKTTSMTVQVFFGGWGTPYGRTGLWTSTGNVFSATAGSGPFIADGQWHFVVTTEDPTPTDGINSKLYLDGRLVNTGTTLQNVVLGGANFFRVGAWSDGTTQFTGEVDGAFVCGYILTLDQIKALYVKGTQTLAPSPKNVGDHIEAMSSTDLLAVFDSLDPQHQIDLKVAA